MGKNKDSKDGVKDYVLGVKRFADVADYLVINVSSPNTPGLRDMQGRQQLKQLVTQVRTAIIFNLEKAKVTLLSSPILLVKE